MKPSGRLQKLLESFLSEKGLTAQFTLNMKKHGANRIKNIEDLCKVIVHSKIGWNKAIFWGFCWTHTDENKENPSYWYFISREWKLFIKDQQKQEAIAIKNQKDIIRGIIHGHTEII